MLINKIFILTNSLTSGGAEKQSVLLTSVLKKEFRPILVVYDTKKNSDSKLYQLSLINKIEIIFITGPKFIKVIKSIYIFLKERPDIIFSYLAFTNFINGFVGYIVRIRFRIGGIRNVYTSPRKFHFQKTIHNCLLTASISNSFSGALSHSSGGFNKKPIFVIPNCIEKIIEPIIRESKNIITLITVGRFVKQKNYQNLIKVFNKASQKLSKDHCDLKLRLVIIGYGPEEQSLRILIEKEKLIDSVSIYINPKNLNDFYREADIYISTSLFEGLSNSIMEAMNHSLPIIATDVGDNNKLVIENINGCLIKLSNLENMVDRIIFLSINTDLRKKMGINSHQILSENYNKDVFRKLYENLIGNEFKNSE